MITDKNSVYISPISPICVPSFLSKLLQFTNLLLHSINATHLQQLTTSPHRIITKTIWIISLVSLFNDVASEMLIPIMPIFLKHIGYGVVFIGVLEGIAELVAGLTKPYFGKQSDALGKRLPFVQLGYALSAVGKSMLVIFAYPLWILLSKSMDKLGKGLRTAARDAMLSDECSKETKGQVFGFHRSMDTLGAVIGPAIALLYLYFFPFDYKTLFLFAIVPGLVAVTLTFFVKEKNKNPTKPLNPPKLLNFTGYWKTAPPQYKKLVMGLILFALFNSSDVFLLLKMKESGLTDTRVIGVYIFYNLIYALLAYPIGILADKLGIKKIFLLGLFVFAVVYTGFAFNTNWILYLVLFALYGFTPQQPKVFPKHGLAILLIKAKLLQPLVLTPDFKVLQLYLPAVFADCYGIILAQLPLF
jgi:MFS family permease